MIGDLISLFHGADGWQKGLIAVVAFLGLEVISRKMPNGLIYKYVQKWGVVVDVFLKTSALMLSKFLLRWLPKKIAEHAEEGVISTLCVFVSAFLKPIADAPKTFVDHLTSDNGKVQRLRK